MLGASESSGIHLKGKLGCGSVSPENVLRKAVSPQNVGSGIAGNPGKQYLALSNRSKDFPGG